MEFTGAKTAIFLGPQLLVIERDNIPDIPWPGHWDLPGGGREGDESPVDCALRETMEEVGLCLGADDLIWSQSYPRPHGFVWFFVAHLAASRAEDIRFGNEGQGWTLMTPDAYLEHPRNIPHFADQLRMYLRRPDATARLAAS